MIFLMFVQRQLSQIIHVFLITQKECTEKSKTKGEEKEQQCRNPEPLYAVDRL